MAGLALRVEPPNLTAQGAFKPANVLLPGWSNGFDTAYDVTVVNPLQNKYVAESAVRPGAALEGANKKKRKGAEAKCREQAGVYILLNENRISVGRIFQ